MIMRIAAIAALLAAPAVAQSNCVATAEADRQLSDRHGEGVVAYGMMRSGGLMQIWTNPKTGSFSAVVTDGNISCIAASGSSFAITPLPPNLEPHDPRAESSP